MNPLNEIEDEKAQRDLGTFAARIFMGALEESGSVLVAFYATAAVFRGNAGDPKDDEDDNT